VELPPTEPRLVSHAFSFPFSREGARAVAAELARRGFTRVWVGEETTGDDYWHVVGWQMQPLTERSVANTTRWMVPLARQHGGEYDGWSLPAASKLG